jgi:hypothetical protein
MQEERATVSEIRKALGDSQWVTRRMLKRHGNQFPTRDQVELWRKNPPAWSLQEKKKRANHQAEKVTVTCPACGFSIRVKAKTARYARNYEGLYCGRNACDYRPPKTGGMVTVIEYNAVGSFTGWKHVFPDSEQTASIMRARNLAAAAPAVQPGSPAQRIVRALTVPAGVGTHIVTVNDWSTGVTVDADETVEIEDPMVAADLHRMVTEGEDASIIVRTFTGEVSHTLASGAKVPVKEVRGWYLNEGVFQPMDEQVIFSASCTDTETGEPIAPERGVRYVDAYAVEV